LTSKISGLESKAAKHGFDRLKPGPNCAAVDVRRHQRERLQRAMIELVAEGGYRAVTVRKLTKLAGVSTGAFYLQFKGTDECFLDTYEALMERTQRLVASTRTPFCSHREQSKRSIRALIDNIAADPSAARLSLVEVFGGGPAVLMLVRAHEARLEVALRESIDRRDQRISATTARWIVAGILRWARSDLMAQSGARPDGSVGRKVRWGDQLVAMDELGAPPSSPDPERRSLRMPIAGASVDLQGGDETELIFAAVMKLALADGYWRLSASRVSKAAGIPKTHFKRHFADVEACYLAAIRRTARLLFGQGATRPGLPGGWLAAMRQSVLEFSGRAAADPASASLVLSGVLESGLGGLTCREALISEIAALWGEAIPSAERPDRVTLEAAIAALWGAVRDSFHHSQQGLLHQTAPTFARLFLASLVDRAEGIPGLSPDAGRIRIITAAAPTRV
jgi:AcrR family transcriptional regulator